MKKLLSIFTVLFVMFIFLVSCDNKDNSSNETIISKSYESIELDTTNVKKDYELGENISTYGLIVYGIESSQQKYKLRNDEYKINIYYKDVIVTSYKEVGDYKVEVEYIGGLECKNKLASYNVKFNSVTTAPSEPVVPDTPSEPVVPDTPSVPGDDEDEVQTLSADSRITLISATSIDVDISDLLDEITSIDIKLESQSKTITLKSLKETISDLNSNELYTISGNYKGKLDEKDCIVNIKATSISTKVVETLSNIEVDRIDIKSHANLVELPIDSFVANVPNDYILKCFEVSDEDGNLIKTIPYEENMETLFVNELDNNSKYLIQSCYSKKVSTSTFSLRRSVNYTYDFKFVGIWVLTYGDEVCRVRMRYNDTTLYTYYVAPGIYRENDFFYEFVLPNELKDYTIVGCEEDLTNISTDVDCNLILHKPSSTPVVYFYGFAGNVISIQNVALNTAATAPEMTDMTLKDVLYTFDGWDTNYSNVVTDLFIHPIYNYVPVYEVPNNPIMNYYVFSDQIMIKRGYFPLNTKPIVSVREYIEDQYGYKIAEYDNVPWTKTIKGLSAESNYKYTVEINYDLEDGRGIQQLTQSVEFKTLAENSILNSTINIARNQYHNNIDITCYDAEFDDIAYMHEDMIDVFHSVDSQYQTLETAFDYTYYEVGDIIEFKLVKGSGTEYVYHVYDNEIKYVIDEIILPEIIGVTFDYDNTEFIIIGNNLEFNTEFSYNSIRVHYDDLERDDLISYYINLDVISVTDNMIIAKFNRPGVVNPETNEFEYYAIEISGLMHFDWGYNGYVPFRHNTIYHQLPTYILN